MGFKENDNSSKVKSQKVPSQQPNTKKSGGHIYRDDVGSNPPPKSTSPGIPGKKTNK